MNARAVRRELEGRGSIFGTTTDSEVVLHLLARSREATLEDRLIDALSRVKGAFSLVLLSHDALVAVRDPNGFRPLTLGRLDGAWVVASETCALDLIGAEVERDLDPGEAVVIRRGRLRTLRPFARAARESFCIFEYIYFARPDSNLRGGNVYAFRKELGRLLAREHPVEADMVVPLLDSGTAAALGYAEESGIPYETALIRNHFVHRTFIEPAQSIRHFGVKVKHNAIRSILAGRRVVLVDDSIIRGTTLIKIATMLRAAGAREVHVRISAPPTVGPCHYGIDMPTRTELIAHRMSVEEIRVASLGVESLGYLSLEGLRSMARTLKHGICDACFSDEYPVPIEIDEATPQLSLFKPLEDEADDGARPQRRRRRRARREPTRAMSAKRPPAGMLGLEELRREIETGAIDTVVTAFPDLYGRLVGKRITGAFFLDEVVGHGMHVCDYLLASDMEMDPTPGYAFASWETGYGDVHCLPDFATLRRAAWLERTALVLCDVEREGQRVEVAPRSVLRRQLERARARGLVAKMGSELEFFLFRGDYREARRAGHRGLERDRGLRRGLPRPLGHLRRGRDPRDPQRRRRLGHPGRVQQGRVGPGPARDQPALRRGPRDGRPPRGLQAGREGDRQRAGLLAHLHGQVGRRPRGEQPATCTRASGTSATRRSSPAASPSKARACARARPSATSSAACWPTPGSSPGSSRRR